MLTNNLDALKMLDRLNNAGATTREKLTVLDCSHSQLATLQRAGSPFTAAEAVADHYGPDQPERARSCRPQHHRQ